MATDWANRTKALAYFEKASKMLRSANDDDKEMYIEAVNALRRSQDHTAIQNKLNAAMRVIRKIANNPDCSLASCGITCREFLAATEPPDTASGKQPPTAPDRSLTD